MQDEPLYDIVSRYVQNADSKDTHSAIATRIIDAGLTHLTHRTVRKAVSEYRSSDQEFKVAGDLEGDPYKPSWTVERDSYKIPYKKAIVTVPVSLADKIFEDYAEVGANLSSQEIIQKYDLTPQKWHAIKGALNLYKKSDIFSPYTIDNTPVSELEEVIEEKIGKLMRSKKTTLKAYTKSLHRTYKKVIEEQKLKDIRYQAFVDEFLEGSDQLIPVSTTIRTGDTLHSPKEAVLVITDLHYGAETKKGLKRTPAYSVELLIERLNKIITMTNAQGYTKVTVVCLGDIIESFTGMNHPNSWKGVQAGKWGAGAVIGAYNMLLNMVNGIVGFDKLYIVPGNHDRSTSSNKEDTEGEITSIVSYFLNNALMQALCLEDDVVINMNSIGSFEFGEHMNIIGTHGDLFLSRQNGPTMSWKYGKQGKFNLILMGHWHSRMIKNGDDGMDFRKVVCPPVFTGNMFSEQGGFDGCGGFLLITENELGLPRITDESI